MTSPANPIPLRERIETAARFVAGHRKGFRPRLGIVLGSGLGPLAAKVEDPVHVPFAGIPHFPVSTVSGHAGELVLGTLRGHPVVVQKGRAHFYEGHSGEAIGFPIRVMKALGIETLILSNAAGGLNRGYRTGDLMVIEDHIDMVFANPLVGGHDPTLGPRFVDMSEPYSPRLAGIALETGLSLGMRMQHGVLVSVAGPNYETMAELRMLARAGADAVGMSVVPEVQVARHAGITSILGLTCITDMATGEAGEPISHDKVLEAAKGLERGFVSLVEGVLDRL